MLDSKGVAYEEYPIDGDQQARIAMSNRADGRSTVPQIFINDRGIGGCDDLFALDRENQLDALIGLVP